jgi:DNA-binding response OmpR family regulator
MPTTPSPAREPDLPRILLVEDDEGNREVLAYFLRRRGFHVSTATCGEEGLAALESDTFHLVVLDVVMPGIGGLETLRLLRARFPAATLPVVMVTGLDTGDDVDAARQLGANDYVTKPYELSDALARIRALL